MSNLFGRLAIGTANFGREYNGARVSDDDQKRILDYAMASGIDLIDTSTSYGWDWTKINSYFKIVLKVNYLDNPREILDKNAEHSLYCIMADDFAYYQEGFLCHYSKRDYNGKLGVSFYEPHEVQDNILDVIQVSYSLFDRRFERMMELNAQRPCPKEIHVRSVFLRGRILKKTTPQECVKFCLCNPLIDRVIIGADSFEQFRQNVHFLYEWQRLERHDESLLDPRDWTE